MNMNDKLKEIFNRIQAEEELKNSTRAFLAQKMQETANTRTTMRPRLIYASAFACLLFMLLGGRWIYFTTTARISIDINPSIELNVNRFNQVISINSFNEDGLELSKTLNVKFKNYMNAIEQILTDDKIAVLLSNNEIMTITVTGSNGQQSANILSDVEACTAKHKNTHCYLAPTDEAAAARKMGLSYGKYKAFLELQYLNPAITPEAVQGMTMREIRECIDSLSTNTHH